MEVPSVISIGLSDIEQEQFKHEIHIFNEHIIQNPYDFSASINLGKALCRKKKFDKAIKAYEAAIEQIVSYGKAVANMKLSLEMKDKLSDSALISSMAEELNPEQAEVHYQLGLAYLGQHNREEAISSFKTAIKFEPNLNKASFQLCWALYDQCDVEQALKLYTKIDKPPVDDLLSYYTLGILLGRTEKIAQTIEVCDLEMMANPFNARVYITKFFALCYQEKFGEAAELFKIAKDIDSKETLAYSPFLEMIDNSIDQQPSNQNKEKTDKRHICLYYKIGVILERQGFLDKAILAYQKVIEINPQYEEIYFKLGLIFQKQENFEEAANAFQTASMIYSNCIKCYIHLGEVFRDNKKLEDAVVAFSNAIMIAPNHVEANFKLGLVLESQGKIEEAIKVYHKVTQVDSFHSDAFVKLGRISHNQKRLDEAIIYFITALQLRPQDAAIHNDLGLVLQEQGDIRGAIHNFETAISLDPNYAKAHRNLGVATMNQGKLREAIDIFNKAINLDPECIISYCYRGKIFNSLEVEDQALADFNKAYELLHGDEHDLTVSTRKSKHIIDEVLGSERENLLKKLTNLHKDALKTESMMENMQLDESGIEEEFEAMKKSVRKITEKVVGHLQMQYAPAYEKQSYEQHAYAPAYEKEKHSYEQHAYEKHAPEKQAKEKEESSQEFDQLKKEINDLKEMNLKFQKMLLEQNEAMKKINKIVVVSGLEDKAMIKERFTNLALENTEVFKYCKTFYWTLVNYFTAYRTLSTNMIDGNLDADDTMMNAAVEKGSQGLLKAAGALMHGVPIVGNAIQILNVAVDYSIEANKEFKLFRKVEIISKVLMNGANILLEEDLSLLCAKTALNVSDAKMNMIISQSKALSLNKGKIDGFLKEGLAKLKGMVLPSINLGDSPTVELALADVAILLSCILIGHQEILNSKQPLDQQFTKLVIDANWNKYKRQNINKKNQAEKCSECNVF